MRYHVQMYRELTYTSLQPRYDSTTIIVVKRAKKISRHYIVKIKQTKIFRAATPYLAAKKRLKCGAVLKLQNTYTATRKQAVAFTPFNCNFLRREKLYTKLKYSRSPQYDIVSGGVAAIFSGFIGFLISEKFGIELVDSGDFYFLFMYCVFFSFSLKPFTRVSSKFDNTTPVCSIWPLLELLVTSWRSLAAVLVTTTCRYLQPLNYLSRLWFL